MANLFKNWTKIFKIHIAAFLIFSNVFSNNIVSVYWNGEYVECAEGQIIVGLKDGINSEEMSGLFDEFELSILKDFDFLNIGLLQITGNNDLIETINLLNENSSVSFAEPNMKNYICQTSPNDPYFKGTTPATYRYQYALHNIGQNPPGGTNDADIDAPEAWDYEVGNSNILIAVLDSGIPLMDGDLCHEDLDDVNRFILGLDCVGDGNGVKDEHGHGTHVTGIIAAETNNNKGIAGVAWNCQILINQVFDVEGWADDYYIYAAVKYAVQNNAKIINFSGGGAYSIIKEKAVQYAHNNNVLQIYSAGNNAGSKDPYILYPARFAFAYNGKPGFSTVVAVAATNYDDNRAEYSSYGQSEINICIAAPGGAGDNGDPVDSGDIFSTMPNYQVVLNGFPTYVSQTYGYLAGTSMAAPHVSGLAALILSKFPNLTASEVRELIEKSAEKVGGYNYNVDQNHPGFSYELGAGRINAFYAVAPPATPQNLQQVATYGQSAKLTWDENIEPDLRRYRIYRKSDMYPDWVMRGYATGTSWTDPDVIIGPPMTTWYWKIKAEDWSGQKSPYSNTVSAIGLIKPAVNNPDEIPDTYMITQNYPNPFNPNTTITFDLPEDNFVNLVVYDINGKLVATLANNQLSAGSYNVNFDASHLPSGVYFYKISTGSFSQIKRMLLIK